VLSSIPADPTPDLHPDTLNALSALMLAQAQECFVRKAMSGVLSLSSSLSVCLSVCLSLCLSVHF